MNPQGKPDGILGRLLAAPAASTLLLVCILAFIAAEGSGSTKDTATLLRFGAVWRGLVWQGEWWRLFTSMFLHIGIVHLVWNCWAGFQWAAPVEKALGAPRFLVLYVLSGLAGSATSVIGHDAVAAGASGALFGVVGATFALLRFKVGSWKALWQHPAHQRNLSMAALWFVVGAFAGFDNFAHAGGLAAGLSLTWTLRPDLEGDVALRRFALAGGAIAALVVASLHPLPVVHERSRILAQVHAADARGDFDTVISLTEGWRETGASEDGPVLSLRARALSEKSRWADTELAASRAISLQPDFGYLFQVRALARSHLGKDEDAIADCREAERLTPGQPWPFELEAQLHLRAGAYDQAEQAAKKAVDRGLTPHRALLRAEALRRLGRADEALELLRQDAGAVPETTLAWKAELLARLNHRDEAEALLAGLDAGALAVHRARCLIHVQAGELQMAEAACALADPSELDVAWAIALLDLRAGRPEKARAIAEAELARRRTRMALTLLAGVRIVEGDPAEAQRLADEVRDGGATDLELAELDALLKWTRDAGR